MSRPLTEAEVLQRHAPRFSRTLAAEAVRGEIYLANHSLGRPLDRMADDVRGALDHWYGSMDAAWGPWLEEMGRFRAGVARLVGSSRPDAVVPKTSAGQGLRAVLNALVGDRPVRVVASRGEFDSVDFILKTYAHRGLAQVRWVEAKGDEQGVPLVRLEDLLAAIREGTDLVVVSAGYFTTGQLLEGIENLARAAHESGALLLVDTYHAAGVIPLELESMEVDFSIGGCYKYLRGGPGACWLAIHPRHLEGDLRTLDTGWFAKRNTFGYERPEEPLLAEGGDGWLESTPPILMPFQAKAGLEFTLELGLGTIRSYVLGLLEQFREACRSEGVPIFSPRRPEAWGAFALLPHPEASAFAGTLKSRGVNVDARGGYVRFGPDVLTTTDELSRAAAIVARARAER
jgi:kynureninase